MASPIISPFQGITGVQSAKDIVLNTKYKIAIIGAPKSGKDWFAATAPGIIRVYDFDDRKDSLKEHKNAANLFPITLRDKNSSRPQAIQQLETELSTYQANKIKGLPVPDFFVFSTVTFMIQALENEDFRTNSTIYRKTKMGNKELMIGSGWDYFKTMESHVQYFLSEFNALGSVIFIFHAKDEVDKDKSTKDEKKYTGQMTINPQYMEPTLSLFNEVFMIEAEAGVNDKVAPTYKVTCRPTASIRASTTLLLDVVEPPDLMAMIAKSEAKRKGAFLSKTLT